MRYLVVLFLAIGAARADVWVSAGNTIWVYDDDSNITGRICDRSGRHNLCMARVGNEIWVGSDSRVRRFSFEGIYLGYFQFPDQYVKTIAVVNNEVWIGWEYQIVRYDFQANMLGSFQIPITEHIDIILHAPDACFGDINQDRVVDLNDLTRLLSDFGCWVAYDDPSLVCTSDLDGDCVVGLDDLTILLSRFGETCP